MHAFWRSALTNPHKEPFVALRNLSSVKRIAALSAIITILYLSSTCAQTGSSPELSALTAGGIESSAFHSDEKPAMSIDLFLEVHVSTSEQSKDSHGRSRSVVVKDGLVTYSVRYSGMDPRPASKESFSLSKENLAKLVAYIIQKGLNRDLREIRSNATLGTSINVSTKIELGGAVTEAKVSGAYSDWTRIPRHKTPSNLENLDYYHDINGLLMFMRSALGFAAIEP
jgi:hypothetical protein